MQYYATSWSNGINILTQECCITLLQRFQQSLKSYLNPSVRATYGATLAHINYI